MKTTIRKFHLEANDIYTFQPLHSILTCCVTEHWLLLLLIIPPLLYLCLYQFPWLNGFWNDEWIIKFAVLCYESHLMLVYVTQPAKKFQSNQISSFVLFFVVFLFFRLRKKVIINNSLIIIPCWKWLCLTLESNCIIFWIIHSDICQ